MKEAFIDWRPQTHSEHRLNRAITLLEEHGPLTLKQVYNMLDLDVSQDSFGETLSNARLAGRLDWDLIIDGPSRITGVTTAYNNVEVWIESEAMAPWVWSVTRPWQVPVVALRSFPPIGMLYRAHKRNAAIIHLSSTPDLDLESLLSVFQPTNPVTRIDLPERIDALDPGELTESIVSYMTDMVGLPKESILSNEERSNRGWVSAEAELATVGEEFDAFVLSLRQAMKETGDTTRAASLKRKIEELLG